MRTVRVRVTSPVLAVPVKITVERLPFGHTYEFKINIFFSDFDLNFPPMGCEITFIKQVYVECAFMIRFL